MEFEELEIYGKSFASLSCLESGDYAGSSHTASNIRVLKKKYEYSEINSGYLTRPEYHEKCIPDEIKNGEAKVILATSDYGYKKIWLSTDCEEFIEILTSLDTYPVIDETDLSELELEWESAAWDGGGDKEFEECLPPAWREIFNQLKTVDKDEWGYELRYIYDMASQDLNIYPNVETNYSDLGINDNFKSALPEFLAKNTETFMKDLALLIKLPESSKNANKVLTAAEQGNDEAMVSWLSQAIMAHNLKKSVIRNEEVMEL